MRSSSILPKATIAGLIVVMLAGTANATYFLTRVDARTVSSVDPAIKVQTFTTPNALVALTNTSARSVRCRMNFFTGTVPAGYSEHTIGPHERWIERSPVAGPVGVINVDVSCS